MLRELLNSKMFWLFLATILGLLSGSIVKRITESRQSKTSLGMPFIGIYLSIMMLFFVKLNVKYFDIKFTLIGIVLMLILSLILGYMTYLSNNKKLSYFKNFIFVYVGLSFVIFYVFYKNEILIDTTQCPETQDIYLVLKKEDAGYFEINKQGIGYVGSTLFYNGFRPNFEYRGMTTNFYSHTPEAVELKTSYGVAHALKFKGKKGKFFFSLDDQIYYGVVKADEIIMGDLKDAK